MNKEDLQSIAIVMVGACVIAIWLSFHKARVRFHEWWEYIEPSSFYEGMR
jgi:hypothetical protein